MIHVDMQVIEEGMEETCWRNHFNLGLSAKGGFDIAVIGDQQWRSTSAAHERLHAGTEDCSQ